MLSGFLAKMLFIALPWVPCHTVALDPATAELLGNLSETHIEVARHEVNIMRFNQFRKSIPEANPLIFPFYLHGAAIPMHSARNDVVAKKCDVLLEFNSGH